MMHCHATHSVAAKYMSDITGCDLIARAITNIYAVNRNFVKCYSNKNRITALEAPLQAQRITALEAPLQAQRITALEAPLQAQRITALEAPLQAQRITALEAPLQAQHKEVCSAFVAYMERKL